MNTITLLLLFIFPWCRWFVKIDKQNVKELCTTKSENNKQPATNWNKRKKTPSSLDLSSQIGKYICHTYYIYAHTQCMSTKSIQSKQHFFVVVAVNIISPVKVWFCINTLWVFYTCRFDSICQRAKKQRENRFPIKCEPRVFLCCAFFFALPFFLRWNIHSQRLFNRPRTNGFTFYYFKQASGKKGES